MELNKLSASYTLKDVTDTLRTEGRVSVEQNGTIRIEFNSNSTNIVEGISPNWGSVNYVKQSDGNVNVYFNFASNYKVEFVDYCEKLFEEILAALN